MLSDRFDVNLIILLVLGAVFVLMSPPINRAKLIRFNAWLVMWHLFAPQFDFWVDFFATIIGFFLCEFLYNFINIFTKNEKTHINNELFCGFVPSDNFIKRGGLFITKNGGFSSVLDEKTLFSKHDVNLFIIELEKQKRIVIFIHQKKANRMIYMLEQEGNIDKIINNFNDELKAVVTDNKNKVN